MKKILRLLTSRMVLLFVLMGLQALLLILLVMFLSEVFHIFALGFTIFGLITVIYITNKTQNASYKISWVILILTVPVLGLMFYLMFSQTGATKRLLKNSAYAYDYTQDNIEKYNVQMDLNEEGARQSRYIHNVSGYPVFENTKTHYYPTGEAFFEGLKEELGKAKKYIFMEYFIVEEGEMWGDIFDILKQKVKEGVEVRFMYDDLGCMNTLPNKYNEIIKQAGIKCTIFNPFKPTVDSLFNNRDHRKITVIDGYTSFCGGANLADEYINKRMRFGKWKDSAIMLKGYATYAYLSMFLMSWDFFAGEKTEFENYIYELEEQKEEGYVQPFCDNPFDVENICETVYTNMIANAKDYLYFTSPYFMVGDNFMNALCEAAKSGVDVRMITPHIPDKKIVFLITRANYDKLMRAGVKVYEYTPGFIHAKNFVCDDKYAVVGTINTDYRSLYLNFECGLWQYKTKELLKIKEDFLHTLQECKEQQIVNKNIFVKFFEAILRLFAPLM